MNLRVSKEELSAAVKLARMTAAKVTSLPILTHIKLVAQDGRLTLESNDGERSVTASIEAEVLEPGGIALPAKLLGEMCQNLTGIVEITVDGLTAKVVAGRTSFSLSGLPLDEFPNTASVSDKVAMEVGAKQLDEVIEQTLFCCSNDETHQALRGVRLHWKDGILTAVSTDTHRLAIRRIEVPICTEEFECIVHRDALEVFSKALVAAPEKVQLRVAPNGIILVAGDTSVYSRNIEGAFPNYERAIPTKFDSSIVGQREMWLGTMKHVAPVLSDDQVKRAIFTVADGQMEVSAKCNSTASVTETIPVVGADTLIAINAVYVREALDAMQGDEVTMQLSGALTQVLMTGACDGYSLILMPMQID